MRFTLDVGFRDDFSEEVTFELRPEERVEFQSRKNFPGNLLVGGRQRAAGTKTKQCGWKLSRGNGASGGEGETRNQIIQNLVAHVQGLGFHPNSDSNLSKG